MNFSIIIRKAECLRRSSYSLKSWMAQCLYFFHGQNVAVLDHGLTKEEVLPPADIERALRRKALFEAAPEKHTSMKELEL